MSVQAHVLIVTEPGDVHAHAVAWGVKALGGRCSVWDSSSIGELRSGVRVEGGVMGSYVELGDGVLELSAVTTVWNRRFSTPRIPFDYPVGDRIVADRECTAYLRGLLEDFSGSVGVSNSYRAQRAMTLKAPQLRCALRAGLQVPDTYIGNDAAAAREFVERNLAVVHKSHFPAAWKVGDTYRYLAGTTLLTPAHVRELGSISFCPGIFQRFVPKAYELRVAVFGETVVAAKIENQDDVDFRVDYGSLTCAPYELPCSVEESLLRFMRLAGLEMGSFDLVRSSEDGAYYFLEVNEQGQFLWVEEKNRDITVLDSCCRFLLGGGANGHDVLRFADFESSESWMEFISSSGERAVDDLAVPEPEPEAVPASL